MKIIHLPLISTTKIKLASKTTLPTSFLFNSLLSTQPGKQSFHQEHLQNLLLRSDTFPEPASKTNALPNIQEVVKVDLIPFGNSEPSPLIEQNISQDVQATPATVAAELLIEGITLCLFNGADERVVQSTLQYIGGMKQVW